MLLNIVQPEWFVPVHGEYTHMVHHARLAESVGVPEDHVLVCEDGDVLTLVLQDDGTTAIDVERRAVPSGFLYVDGIVGDVGQGVLRDRRNLAEEGLVVVIVTVDSTTGEVVTGPEIVTRGWVYAPEAEELLEEAKAAVLASLAGGGRRGRHRLRHPPPPLPPLPRQVHQRAHQAPPGGHPGGHGGLTRTAPPQKVAIRFIVGTSRYLLGVGRAARMLLWVVVRVLRVRGCPRPRRGVVARRPAPRRSRPGKRSVRTTTAARTKAAPAEPGALARGRDAAGRAAGRAPVRRAGGVPVRRRGDLRPRAVDRPGRAGRFGARRRHRRGCSGGPGWRSRSRASRSACVLLWPHRAGGADADPEDGDDDDDAPPNRRPCASPSARSSCSWPTSGSSTSPTAVPRSSGDLDDLRGAGGALGRDDRGAADRGHRRGRGVDRPRRDRAGRRAARARAVDRAGRRRGVACVTRRPPPRPGARSSLAPVGEASTPIAAPVPTGPPPFDYATYDDYGADEPRRRPRPDARARAAPAGDRVPRSRSRPTRTRAGSS